MKIYIGMSKRFECIRGMTERSIREYYEGADIEHLYTNPEEGCTGFTNARFNIRHGVYLDPDMILLTDIRELFKYHREGEFVCMMDGSTEVAVIDCEHDCHHKYETHKLPMRKLIPPEWNCEDFWHPDAKLVHFTDIRHQPWWPENRGYHEDKKLMELYERYSQQ